MRFDLVDLRLFCLVVEQGSITAGARAANMALASASARISFMEERLGIRLLERGRRGATPTTAGRSMLDHARTIGAQVDRMGDDLRRFSAGLRGNVRLFANTAALIELAPRTLRTLLSEHPEIDVELEEHTSAEIVTMLASGRGELGVAADSADTGALETRVLCADRLTAILPLGHAFAQAGRLAFANLLRERFVGLTSGALHDHLLRQAARTGQPIAFRVRVSSFDNVASLVSAGAGVAVVPQAVLGRIDSSSVVALPLTDAWADRRLLACARSFAQLSRNAGLLFRALLQAVPEGDGSAVPVTPQPSPA